jgi:hypothetical protein
MHPEASLQDRNENGSHYGRNIKALPTSRSIPSWNFWRCTFLLYVSTELNNLGDASMTVVDGENLVRTGCRQKAGWRRREELYTNRRR